MNKLKQALLFSAIIILVLPHSIFGQSKFITDSLDIYITREMKRWNIPGVAISIVKDGKVIYQKGFGVREVGKPDKVDENTLFMIASNTKAYTATAVALLDKEKRLSLNEKVTRYLPYFRLKDSLSSRDVTVKDLLSHRIGFFTFQSDFLNWDCNLSRTDLIMNMRHVKPMYGFRTNFGYTNMGFVTAGEVIHAVTDTTWEVFLKYNIFLPLQMTRTTTRNTDIVTDNNAAKPYTIFDGKLVVLKYDSIDNIAPCGGLNSCVKDISNWILMQLDSGKFEGKQVIPFDVLKRTRTSTTIVGDVANPLFPSTHFRTYGLGWFMEDYVGRKIISHDGGANGFVTNTTLVPEEKYGFTILTNTDANAFMDALQMQLLDDAFNVPYRNLSAIYYNKSAKGTAEDDSVTHAMWATAAKKPKPALDLKTYTGKYTNEIYGNIEIKEEKGKLVIHFSHHPHLTGNLEPLGENKFVCNYNPVAWGVKETPFIVVDGKVQSVVISVNGGIDYLPYEFKKDSTN